MGNSVLRKYMYYYLRYIGSYTDVKSKIVENLQISIVHL